MKLAHTVVLSTVALAIICAPEATTAQNTAANSGTPGDGIPDFYYSPVELHIPYWGNGITDLRVAAGMLWIDTDGVDLTHFGIGGPDVSSQGCVLCDGMHLPGMEQSFADASEWIVGYTEGATVWIRTNPLVGRGFVGHSGEFYVDAGGDRQPWPTSDIFIQGVRFIDFPEPGKGFANYGPWLGPVDFSHVFSDGSRAANWNVRWGDSDSNTGFTNITILPEPGASGAGILVALALLCGRTRDWGFQPQS